MTRTELIADLLILEGEQMHSTHAAWVCAAADMLEADRVAMQGALEALENHGGNYKLSRAEGDKQNAVVTALKEALK